MMTHLPTRIVFQMGGFICGTKNGNDQQNDFISILNSTFRIFAYVYQIKEMNWDFLRIQRGIESSFGKMGF